ncbi:unnamed protein product [Blepharisma stoltei]|uniref:Uncharacterized protein n=1 Tax=Blepharisma stoltei TaxID=1481888 RepID=A0AAU9IKG0_9CILI|nr:unnamed protein product [Blepharisma stoltei]
MASLAMKAIGSKLSSNFSTSTISEHNSHIDWHDYNFPPCLKLIHFRLSDFQGNEKALIKKIYVSWILLTIVLSINIISTIVLSATVLPGIDILFTFLNFIIGMVLGTFTFFWGYYGIAKKDSSHLRKFKIGAVILVILYILASCLPFGAFNGWARIPVLNDKSGGAADFGVAMCIIESLIYTVNAGLLAYCIYLVQTDAYDDQSRNFR